MNQQTGVDRYWSYVNDVISGAQVAPQRIIRACERTLAWADDDEMYMDEDILNDYCTFCEQWIIADGHSMNGQQLKLMPWQVWMMGSALSWRYTSDDARVCKQAWFEAGRGASKSAMAALMAIWEAVNNPGCTIAILAGKQDQALVILASVKTFLEHTPDHGLQYSIKQSEVKIGASTINALSAKVHTLDGL